MNQERVFSFRRVALLVKTDLVLYRSAIISSVGAFVSILLLFNLLAPMNIFSVNRYPTMFVLLLLGGGYWLSSNTFNHLHKFPKNYFFMMIPCSNLEKFMAKWLVTSIGYTLVLLAIYSIFYWLLAMTVWIFGTNAPLINTPFAERTWLYILNYIIGQPLFLFGSIYFRRFALVKTILMASLVSILFALILISIIKVFGSEAYFYTNLVKGFEHPIYTMFYYVFWIIISSILLVAGYFRLRELEV